MAAPHVSGIIAGLLSVRNEFIGRPEEIKRLLVDNATDRREANFQGQRPGGYDARHSGK